MKAFADEVGAVFKLTSAFLNTGINELFNELGEKYINRNNPHSDVASAPVSHVKVEEKEVILDERKAKKIVLEHDEKKKNKKKCC